MWDSKSLKAMAVVLVLGCGGKVFLLAAQELGWKSKMTTFMRGKLMNSQHVMEGLVTENYELIGRGAEKMKYMGKQAAWPRSDDPVYGQYNIDFQRQCEKLAEHARDKDLESAQLAFQGITSTCVNCHRYVRTSLRVHRDDSNPESPVRLIPADWEQAKVKPIIAR